MRKYPCDLNKVEIKTHRDTGKQTEMSCFLGIQGKTLQRTCLSGKRGFSTLTLPSTLFDKSLHYATEMIVK